VRGAHRTAASDDPVICNYPVLSENSIEPKSSRIAMIEVEQTTEPFASADGATAVIRRRNERHAEESIADALVVAFQIVVPDILGDDESEMPLAKRDDAAQALSPNGSDERSAKALRLGLRAGSRTFRTPAERSSCEKSAPNTGSRSWMRKRASFRKPSTASSKSGFRPLAILAN
jgi:hypothetical protein